MHLGILLTGRMIEDLVDQLGEMDAMFSSLFQAVDPEVRTTTYTALDGELPSDPHACDAWLVTGSKHGVYEDLPWLGPLTSFLRDSRDASVPLIGVCFGHQLFAQAFGGQASKSDKGWGCGVHDYQVLQQPAWMAGAGSAFAMHAMHQDQVTAVPEDATVLASSAFCPFAMLAYGDPAAPDAISIQPHPEFARDCAKGLLDLRGGVTIPEPTAKAAQETLARETDGLAFARWSLAFVRQALSAKRAA